MNYSNILFKIFHWQNWHYHIKYIPLIPVWIWYCIRSGSLWFFTPSNPKLTLGGMEGETKEEMYNQLPEHSYPKSIFISETESFDTVESRRETIGLNFPVAVKPNVGMMGLMFRIINSKNELELYHNSINAKYVIQDVIKYPLEVSVFYYRHPSKRKGTVSGFLSKEVPKVVGDGNSTLLQLIRDHSELRFHELTFEKKHRKNINKIIPLGHEYILSNASNRGQGGKLICLQHEITDGLIDVFDKLSLYKGNFFYGRYDIKCKSIEDLKKGKNFSILEYNGCGSGTQQIYAYPYTFSQALGIILRHWKALYDISRYNYKQGIKHYDFLSGAKVILKARKNIKVLKKLDLNLSI